MKITVAGMGYVGMSNAVLLAQYNKVIAYDVDTEKINLINQKKSPVKDKDIDFFFQTKDLDLKATSNIKEALDYPDYVIISTPTNFNEKTNNFDTSLVELIVKETITLAPNATIIIKSTIPIGFTDELSKKYQKKHIYFSPEFLREGKALHDNLYPSRIIVGGKTSIAKKFADLLVEGAEKKAIDLLFVGSKEAEAIKLFSNTYLAMRVSFFNEIDSFSIAKKIESSEIIKGISLDPRIGNYYNNPSFGYGGYCLPKDTKQVRSNFNEIPQNLIDAIIYSNETRKRFIANEIISLKPKVVGVFRLIMKKNSDNFRDSAIFDVMRLLFKAGIEIIIYEPELKENLIELFEIVNDLEKFKRLSDLIIANRAENNIVDVGYKVFTRDIFGVD